MSWLAFPHITKLQGHYRPAVAVDAKGRLLIMSERAIELDIPGHQC